MPTLQVTPDASDLLQNVADTLAKSRKIVIITGAGISTNSGIPDFRSENGLYSLIQEQFERAEANVNSTTNIKKELSTPQDQPLATDTDTTATTFDISERPSKRRRTSGSCDISLAKPSPSLIPLALRSHTSVHKPVHEDTKPSSKQQDSTQDPNIATQLPEPSRRITRSQASAKRPILPRHLTQHSVDSSTSHESAFSDPPFSSVSSQTDASTSATAYPVPSSPLSSPPPDLFDPYGNPNSTEASSHDDSDCSEAFEFDSTQQSLDFSSQASSSNLRNMKGRDLFDSNIWADPLKTSVFYRFATSLRQRVREVEPTTTHRFIAQMRDVGKLARVYTQNIDEIEKKIGLSTDLKHGFGNKKRKPTKPQQSLESSEDPIASEGTAAVQVTLKLEDNSSTQSKPLNPSLDRGVECVFLHGSLHSLRCFVCRKLCDWDEDGRESRTLSGEQPECPHCAGATAARQERGKRALGIGKLRPDIVLYGEEHPQSDLISPIVQHDLAAGPDLLLVLGTSLRVHGLKVMVKEFAKAVHKKGGKVVFINFTKPSESAWGDVLDYWIEWDCDAWVDDLKTRKPLLWLSPDERLELDRQKQEIIAERKKEALKKRESINQKKRDVLDLKGEHALEQGNPRPPPKNPVAMRNDYHCGAYIVWDIFQALAKIGGRPFDNLGYTPSAALLASLQESNSDNISSPAVINTVPSRPTRKPQPTLGYDASKPPANKRKRSRKSAPATLVANVQIENEKKPTRDNKSHRRHTGRHQYLQAAKELQKSRKTPTPGNLAVTTRISASPGHPPLTCSSLTFEAGHLDPCSPMLSHSAGSGGICEGDRRHSACEYTSYSFEPRLLPPLPIPPPSRYSAPHPEPAPANDTKSLQGPVLAPLQINWNESPPSKILPMEIVPQVGPMSPLADKQPPLHKPQCPYAWHHSTQPIYNDSLVGITTHNPSRYVESNDENVPASPSDQLRMEAANQLWELRSGS